MTNPIYPAAKSKAEEIIASNGITEPVVPVFEIAEKEGYAIKFFTSEGELAKVAGFTDPKSKTIYVNQSDPVYRQSFTVAHELGHLVLGHKPNEYGVLLRNTNIATNDIEKQANAFAAYLLMPDALIKDIMTKYKLDETRTDLLAGIFGVSTDAMRYRLKRYQTNCD